MDGPHLGQFSSFGTSSGHTCSEENLAASMHWELRTGAFQPEWIECQERETDVFNSYLLLHA